MPKTTNFGQGSAGFGSQGKFGSPSQQYGAPSQQFGGPSQQHGGPSQQYGAPSQQYGAPSQQSAGTPRQLGGFSGQFASSGPSHFGSASQSNQYLAPKQSSGFQRIPQQAFNEETGYQY